MMDLEIHEKPPHVAGVCRCGCTECGRIYSSTSWCRSVKRKIDSEVEGAPEEEKEVSARVEVENEVVALREALVIQQQAIQELEAELDEERNAAASAAGETMSMILRLQREKAETQMEFRQFKRLAEEKMAHDQSEILSLEDLLLKRDETVQALSYEIQEYRHKLLDLGIGDTFFDTDAKYPTLRCSMPEEIGWEDGEDGDPEENFVLGETPREVEQRIYELEYLPGTEDSSAMLEKEVVGSPLRNSSDGLPPEAIYGSKSDTSDKKEEAFPAMACRNLSDCGSSDDICDRVYTIDAVHAKPSSIRCKDHPELISPNVEGFENGDEDDRERDMKKLYARLQALEADREYMKQALISMRTEKAQLVLLREIAQQFCKEAAMGKNIEKRKQSSNASMAAVSQWISSLLMSRKKASRSRYTFGQANKNNTGLLLLLDKSHCMKQISVVKTIPE